MEFKRQNHQQMGTSSSSSLPINTNHEQNALFSPSTLSPGLITMDNPPHPPTLYNPSVYYPHQQQQNNSPAYRSFDSNRSQPPSSHEPHSGISTPIFDEFLTPPPSTSYLSMNNSSLSIHSHMNVSFGEPPGNTMNPSTMTSSNSFNHHNTMYPY